LDGLTYCQWNPSAFFDTPDQIGLTGKNFPLVPGYGYIMNSDVSGTIQVSGVIPTTPITVQLQNGWNIIGIPNGQAGSQASDVLYNLVKAGFPVADLELDQLVNGQWQKYTLGQNQYNAVNDFAITNAQSYALYVYTGGSWTESIYPYPKGLKATKKNTSPSTNVLVMPSN